MTAARRHARTQDPVVDWRRRVLGGAGVPAGLAARLAGDPAYDLHALIELTERGCPPALAERILAPLERRPRRLED